MNDSNRVPAVDRFTAATSGIPTDPPGVRSVGTTDHETIRRWAAEHRAEPATGEATASGPAVIHVHDTGSGIRFNFPGFGRFRPITWEEWFQNFEQHELLFVFEEEDSGQVAVRARERWLARGGDEGRDQEDWFAAERELRQRRQAAGHPGERYRLVKRDAAGAT